MTLITENTDFQQGAVIAFDKEYEWTSFDLVKKIRSLLRKKFDYKKIKVGHAGTLDPLATGLMLICTGKATKQIQELQSFEKEYIAEIHLGHTTPSYDRETDIDSTHPVEHISREILCEKLKLFTGEIMQMPPAFSAKWIDGKRAYDMARAGKSPVMTAVPVKINEIELISFNSPYAVIRVLCGKGTYIRSLAKDIGIALDSGAYLNNLKRSRIGDYLLSESLTIEKFKEIIKYT